MVHIEKDVSEVLFHGTTNLTTANTPSQVITTLPAWPKKGVHLKAGVSNTGNIYVGNSGVTNNLTSAACGFPLKAGEEVFIACEDPRKIHAANATANDIIHWLIV